MADRSVAARKRTSREEMIAIRAALTRDLTARRLTARLSGNKKAAREVKKRG